MVRRSLIPALALLILALGSADAHADPFTISFQPSNPVPGQDVTFSADREHGKGEGDLVWNFGDGTPVATGSEATHAYETAGTYTVTLTALNSDGTIDPQDTTTITVAPKPNAAPSATFSFAPGSPVAGEEVTFTGGSDPDGDAVTRSWDFGDGTTGTGRTASHVYETAGSYAVVLIVTDIHGAFDTSNKTVTVAEPPVDGGTQNFDQLGGSGPPTNPLVPTPNVTTPARMRPFPVVRIAGVILPRGARVRILSVRGPRGMQVSVRCRGRGCPVRTMRLTSATRLARLHRFERRLAVGTMLELFVRKPGKVGKYTRFVIRAGEAPARVDRCLVPGRTRPVRCQ